MNTCKVIKVAWMSHLTKTMFYMKNTERKDDIQRANKDMKRCFTSYVAREMQLKTMKYHYAPIRMTKNQNNDNTKC